MRIACLIRAQPPLISFVNRLHRAHGVALCVVETDPQPLCSGPWQRLRTRGLRGVWVTAAARLVRAIERPPVRPRQRLDPSEILGDSWRTLDDAIPTLTTNAINGPAVKDHLDQARLDVIVDHGTSILDAEVIAKAPLALNIHWGLSPYYRGVCCTEWALINRDPYNIGVTIHKLNRDIDGGAILAQMRAMVEPNDSAERINMKITRLGTDLVIEALNRKIAGGELRFVDQDLSRGFLGWAASWSAHLAAEVRRIENDGLIAEMLRRPARKERLPIIEWDGC